jgi:uncharacterized protein (TIGR00106 family)
MIAEFSVIPMGEGDSISESVARVLDIVDKSGLKYKINPMGTVVEGSWEDVMHLIRECHTLLLEHAPRVYTRIVIDDRKDKNDRIDKKVASVEAHLKRELKK